MQSKRGCGEFGIESHFVSGFGFRYFKTLTVLLVSGVQFIISALASLVKLTKPIAVCAMTEMEF